MEIILTAIHRCPRSNDPGSFAIRRYGFGQKSGSLECIDRVMDKLKNISSGIGYNSTPIFKKFYRMIYFIFAIQCAICMGARILLRNVAFQTSDQHNTAPVLDMATIVPFTNASLTFIIKCGMKLLKYPSEYLPHFNGRSIAYPC